MPQNHKPFGFTVMNGRKWVWIEVIFADRCPELFNSIPATILLWIAYFDSNMLLMIICGVHVNLTKTAVILNCMNGCLGTAADICLFLNTDIYQLDGFWVYSVNTSQRGIK